MSIQDFLDKMKDIQEKTIYFLENTNDEDDIFSYFISILDNHKVKENKHELESFLHLLSKLSNNFHRIPFLYLKIEKILQFFQSDIKNNFSNFEIFNIFKNNKKILLYLIKNKFITIDKFISERMSDEKQQQKDYLFYFYPELTQFLKFDDEDEKEISDKITDDFDIKREVGENESYLCKLIRNDSIDDFVIYINQSNLSLTDTKIERSIFETNPILLKRTKVTIFEYVTFYGAIRIFNYLLLNGIELTSSLWTFAIHSNNAEIISKLEENNVEPEDDSYTNLLYEAIKCHHNDIVRYLHSNYSEKLGKYSIYTFSIILQKYNFEFIRPNLINKYTFKYLCKYGYYDLVEYLIKNENININQLIRIFFYYL